MSDHASPLDALCTNVDRHLADRVRMERDEVRESAQTLRSFISDEWLARAEPHPLRIYLTQGFTSSGGFALHIGRDIASLQHADTPNVGAVANALLTGGNQQGQRTTFESFYHSRAVLAAAARLVRVGLHVTLEPPGDHRRADIFVVSEEGCASIEVKTQGSSITSDRLIRTELDLNMALRLPPGRYEIFIDRELLRRWGGLEDDAVRLESVRMVSEALERCAARIPKSAKSTDLVEACYGVGLRLLSRDCDGGQFSYNYGGREVSWVPDDSTFIRSLLCREVSCQLPQNMAGLVLAEFVGIRANIEYVDHLFGAACRAYAEDWEHVSGLLLSRGPRNPRPVYQHCPNPRSRFSTPLWLVQALNHEPGI